jgi:hypothetical protein
VPQSLLLPAGDVGEGEESGGGGRVRRKRRRFALWYLPENGRRE